MFFYSYFKPLNTATHTGAHVKTHSDHACMPLHPSQKSLKWALKAISWASFLAPGSTHAVDQSNLSALSSSLQIYQPNVSNTHIFKEKSILSFKPDVRLKTK